MEWLHPFLTLSLCCGAAMALLPRGSLRSTAALAVGLMLTVCWAECVCTALDAPSPVQGASWLAETGFSFENALHVIAEQYGGE